ncbi:MAG: hypothetical protein U0271_14965 [Polyangiaceae bacterium]
MRLASVVVGLVLAGCVGGGEIEVGGGGQASGAAGGGGSGAGPSTGGSGGTVATSGGAGGIADGGGGGVTDGGGGAGGFAEGGSGPGWPTCDSQPIGSPTKTLSAIWSDNPPFPAEAWVPGVYVSAVSKNGCVAGEACQFFVQSLESYPTLAAATHQSLRVGVAPSVSSYFVGLAVGDQVNLYASAFRDTADGKNELQFLVTPALPGCAKKVGTGNLTPLVVTLDALTVSFYEDTVGPVFVHVDDVSGNPNNPDKTFALWKTGMAPNGDITTVTSMSPFFLPSAVFSNLVANNITDFDYVEGVFGLFTPPAMPLIKYEEIYVRSVADYPILP